MFVLQQHSVILDDLIISADNCPVLTTVRAQYFRYFLFSLDLHRKVFLRTVFWLPTLDRFTQLKCLGKFILNTTESLKQFLRRTRCSSGVSRSILLQEDTVGKIVILCNLAFSRSSISVCKQTTKVIHCRNSLVTKSWRKDCSEEKKSSFISASVQTLMNQYLSLLVICHVSCSGGDVICYFPGTIWSTR